MVVSQPVLWYHNSSVEPCLGRKMAVEAQICRNNPAVGIALPYNYSLQQYGMPFVSKRILQQTCSKVHVFNQLQRNNDGFYSAKTVIFGEY